MPKENPVRRRGRQRSGAAVSVVRALCRGLDALDALAKLKEASLTEISVEIDLPVSSTYRILETLASRGYAHFIPGTGKYRLGIRAFETGYAFVSQTRLKETADPVMQRLAAESGESVNLAVLDAGEVVYIHQAEGRGMMRLFTRMGARAPVYCTGVGKCLLAWLGAQEVLKHLPVDPFPRFTPYTITTREEFIKVLKKVRRNGYATDDEEREEGVSCVTAPIKNVVGDVVGAISLSGPTTRIKRQGVAVLKKMVMAAADEISSSLAASG
jgi:IclR family acetate operon transcriptional repressor